MRVGIRGELLRLEFPRLCVPDQNNQIYYNEGVRGVTYPFASGEEAVECAEHAEQLERSEYSPWKWGRVFSPARVLRHLNEGLYRAMRGLPLYPYPNRFTIQGNIFNLLDTILPSGQARRIARHTVTWHSARFRF